MALNTWINPLNKVSLTGSVDITADSIRLIVYNEDAGQEEITNVLSLFLMYDNISAVEDVNISLGGGQYYTIKQWVGTIDDNHIPGLQSLIDYLQANYRAIDDDSVIHNYYTINKTLHDTINTYNDYNYNKTVQQTIKSFKTYNTNTNEFNYTKKNIVNNISNTFKDYNYKTDEFNYHNKILLIISQLRKYRYS
jgi:hypothetical protein